MAGSDRLEEELRAAGAPTVPAEITSAKESRFTVSRGASAYDQVASATSTWKLKLRVQPEGGEPYEVELKEPYPKTDGGPRVGRTIGVLVDPKDRTRVAIDHSAAGLAIQALSGISPKMQATLESAVGGGSAQDIMTEALADPAAFRAKMAERAAPTLMVGGQPWTGMPTPPAPPAPPAPAPASTADELTKLADLRDRGVLTEEEFQAQKQRVLGG